MGNAAYLPPIEATPEQVAQTLFPPRPVSHKALLDAIERRDDLWAGHPLIPSWVDLNTVNLDRFFTRPAVARDCHKALLAAMAEDHADPANYKFVEPGAGNGAFFDLLPEERRIGIDLVSARLDILQHDFLTWRPPSNGRRYAVIGNPPFGYRAWLALAFVNHAATFADYIGMILPMAFQSDGKGSPKHRVMGAELVDMRTLPADSFTTETGQPAKINALWQVWRRGVNNRAPVKTCNDWIDLFTVDMRKERLCGQKRLHEADWFLQRTFYDDPPTLVPDFAEVRYVCGYGIVIKKQKGEITEALRKADWLKHSNLAAHNCHHISMYHIRQAVIDAGFADG